MNQNIIVELSTEDRALLRKIGETLSGRIDEAVRLIIAAINKQPSLEKPAEALQNAQESTEAPERVNTPATEEKAPEAPQDAPADVSKAPDRVTVKRVAVKKIQAGHRDDVKALIREYGSEQIDLVPEDKLAEFFEKLQKIGG